MSHPIWQLPVTRVLGALALCFAAAVFANPAQAQTTIVTGMVAHGPPQWPQYIAEEFGWLKQDKIELDFIAVGGQLAARSFRCRAPLTLNPNAAASAIEILPRRG